MSGAFVDSGFSLRAVSSVRGRMSTHGGSLEEGISGDNKFIFKAHGTL